MLNINFTPFPNLATERLVLRQLNIEDANELSLLRSDERVNEFIDRSPSTNIEEAKKFIEKINNGIAANESVYWVIALKDGLSLIGTICFWNISIKDDVAEIGYELKPPSATFSRSVLQHFPVFRLKYNYALVQI